MWLPVVPDISRRSAWMGSGGSIGAPCARRPELPARVVARWLRDGSVAVQVGVTQLGHRRSTGMGAAEASADTDRPRIGFLAAGLAVYVCWNLGTLLGAIAGELSSATRTTGASMPPSATARRPPWRRTYSERPGRVAPTCARPGDRRAAVASPPVCRYWSPPSAWCRRRGSDRRSRRRTMTTTSRSATRTCRERMIA